MDSIVASRSFYSRSDKRVAHRDALDLLACPLRYVLEEGAAGQCGDLLRECPDLMTLERDILRLPAESFWLEWPAEREVENEDSGRLGCLVKGAPDGRSGTIFPFYGAPDGRAERLPGEITFDLDEDEVAHLGNGRTYNHNMFGHLNPILARATMKMDGGWLGQHSGEGLERSLSSQAEASWFFLPFLLTFSVLLFSPNVLAVTAQAHAPSTYSRPGKRARMLDHFEVSLHLGEYRTPQESAPANGRNQREQPRLHLVRGHYVSRGNKTFWRMSHLRGAGEWAGYSKTIKVKAARANRNRPSSSPSLSPVRRRSS